jgi:hypothetical protein
MKNEIFINKANLKHKYKYDYSKVNYINSYTKIVIIFFENSRISLRNSIYI